MKPLINFTLSLFNQPNHWVVFQSKETLQGSYNLRDEKGVRIETIQRGTGVELLNLKQAIRGNGVMYDKVRVGGKEGFIWSRAFEKRTATSAIAPKRAANSASASKAPRLSSGVTSSGNIERNEVDQDQRSKDGYVKLTGKFLPALRPFVSKFISVEQAGTDSDTFYLIAQTKTGKYVCLGSSGGDYATPTEISDKDDPTSRVTGSPYESTDSGGDLITFNSRELLDFFNKDGNVSQVINTNHEGKAGYNSIMQTYREAVLANSPSAVKAVEQGAHYHIIAVKNGRAFRISTEIDNDTTVIREINLGDHDLNGKGINGLTGVNIHSGEVDLSTRSFSKDELAGMLSGKAVSLNIAGTRPEEKNDAGYQALDNKVFKTIQGKVSNIKPGTKTVGSDLYYTLDFVSNGVQFYTSAKKGQDTVDIAGFKGNTKKVVLENDIDTDDLKDFVSKKIDFSRFGGYKMDAATLSMYTDKNFDKFFGTGIRTLQSIKGGSGSPKIEGYALSEQAQSYYIAFFSYEGAPYTIYANVDDGQIHLKKVDDFVKQNAIPGSTEVVVKKPNIQQSWIDAIRDAQ